MVDFCKNHLTLIILLYAGMTFISIVATAMGLLFRNKLK
jgi:hypothetical protein